MGQDSSKMPSKRRVEDAEKVKLLCQENRATMKLSASEIQRLKQLYHRLASLSPENEYIDKQTFLNYFPLEGILAERLFATFDKDKNNVIDYEEFLGGLALCLCGTVDEKFQLVFDLYNIDDSDGISEEELSIVLKSTFMAATAIVSPVWNTPVLGDHSRYDIDEHVQHVVRDAFEQCDTSQTGKLSPEEFRTWAEHHSYILDIIFGHKSFTDKQKISENITTATMKAAEMNSMRYQAQTWVDSPISSEQRSETSRGYSKATYLWSPVFPVMPKAPKARSEHTICVFQGALYLLGGRGTTAYKDFWKYDLALNNWSEIPNTGERPTQIFGHTAALHKGSMYVYGGEFKSCETLIWKYTFENNIWERISHEYSETTSKKTIPGNRRHHSAVIYDNKMYVFGGIIDILGCTSELWSFTFVNNEWNLISQTSKNNPGARYEHSALVYNKAMWIVGGLENYQAKNDLWKLNFGDYSWTRIKTRGGPFPIHGHRVVKCGNAMVIFGGSINREYCNTIWKFDFENQSWSVITPHGNVSPPARSAPAIVTLSAFSLPLLPPQLVNSQQNTTANVLQNNVVEDLRPRSTPEFKSKENPASNVTRPRHWSVSTDSLYQPPISSSGDKHFSACSLDDLSENNVVSFTNVSYCSSTDEQHFPQSGRNKRPFDCDLKETTRLSRYDAQREENEGNYKGVHWNPDMHCTKKDDTTSGNVELKRLLPQSKEGLCIFLVGGKYCGNHEFFTKSVDIWRCDVTKRHKRSNKVTKINVQTAGTATGSGQNKNPEPFVQQRHISHACGSSQGGGNMKAFVSTCRQDVFKTPESRNMMDEPSTSDFSTLYGDLVVTDLGCSNEPHLLEKN